MYVTTLLYLLIVLTLLHFTLHYFTSLCLLFLLNFTNYTITKQWSQFRVLCVCVVMMVVVVVMGVGVGVEV